MSDDVESAKPRRRWRKIAAGIAALTLLFVAYVAWNTYRWIDPRLVGAWRVTNSRPSAESIYILNKNGSARWLQREGEGDQWWERGPVGAPFYWSVGRDGFLMQNLDSPSAQMGEWLWSLGGLLNKGRLKAPRIGRNPALKIEFLSPDRIRLTRYTPGIIKPLELTLDRIDPESIPPAQP